MLINYYNTILFVFQVHMTTFLLYKECQYSIRIIYLNVHGYDEEDDIMEEIPAGECSYAY